MVVWLLAVMVPSAWRLYQAWPACPPCLALSLTARPPTPPQPMWTTTLPTSMDSTVRARYNVIFLNFCYNIVTKTLIHTDFQPDLGLFKGLNHNLCFNCADPSDEWASQIAQHCAEITLNFRECLQRGYLSLHYHHRAIHVARSLSQHTRFHSLSFRDPCVWWACPSNPQSSSPSHVMTPV